MADRNSTHSTLRERIVEHVFVGEALRRLYWLGDEPHLPLPAIAHFPMPRRATHNAEGARPVRQNHRQVPISAFRRLSRLDEVLEALFGDLTPSDPN